MLGDWKCDCRSRTLVDSALAGSQALASFFSAPMSLFDNGNATTTTTSQKPTTSHLVQLPAGISAIRLAPLIDPPAPPPLAPRPFTLTQPRAWWACQVRERAGDGGGAAGDLQPFVDVLQVGAHGSLGQAEPPGDLGVGVPSRHQVQQVGLTGGEPEIGRAHV